MKTTSVLFFLLTITTISTASFAGKPKGIPDNFTQLNAQQITELLTGKTIVGETADGQYKDIYNPDGSFTGHDTSGAKHINSKWSIRDKKKDKKDALCIKEQQKRENCYTIWSDGDTNIFYVYKGRAYPAKVISSEDDSESSLDTPSSGALTTASIDASMEKPAQESALQTNETVDTKARECFIETTSKNNLPKEALEVTYDPTKDGWKKGIYAGAWPEGMCSIFIVLDVTDDKTYADVLYAVAGNKNYSITPGFFIKKKVKIKNGSLHAKRSGRRYGPRFKLVDGNMHGTYKTNWTVSETVMTPIDPSSLNAKASHEQDGQTETTTTASIEASQDTPVTSSLSPIMGNWKGIIFLD